ncbi:MAG TPA: hypothetical protein VFJ18_00390 [Pararhizobium sp.]|nr:hypothetical protein [Pararhizobium sp.]
MPSINEPTIGRTDSRYLAECIFALEPSVTRLIELALAAGWTRDEVANAITILAYDKDGSPSAEDCSDTAFQ